MIGYFLNGLNTRVRLLKNRKCIKAGRFHRRESSPYAQKKYHKMNFILHGHVAKETTRSTRPLYTPSHPFYKYVNWQYSSRNLKHEVVWIQRLLTVVDQKLRIIYFISCPAPANLKKKSLKVKEVILRDPVWHVIGSTGECGTTAVSLSQTSGYGYESPSIRCLLWYKRPRGQAENCPLYASGLQVRSN